MKWNSSYCSRNMNFQDILHSTVHWLQACGIYKKMVDVHMDAEPYIPLPTKNVDKPLTIMQLTGLWFIWGIGLTVGILAFLGEFLAGIKAKKPKNREVENIAWARQWQDFIIFPKKKINHQAIEVTGEIRA